MEAGDRLTIFFLFERSNRTAEGQDVALIHRLCLYEAAVSFVCLPSKLLAVESVPDDSLAIVATSIVELLWREGKETFH